MQENENNNIMQDGEQRYVPKQYRDNKNPALEALVCFLIMIAFLVIQMIVMIPFIIAKIREQGADLDPGLSDMERTAEILESLDTTQVSFVATLVSLIVAVIWYRKVYCRGYRLADLKATCRKCIKPDILAGLFFAAVALYYITFFVVAIIDFVSPASMEKYNELMEDAGMNNVSAKVIILTVVLAPINEECIMRGIILTRLKKSMAPVLAILISAIYFGIFHLNVVQGIYAGVMGLFMAYVAYKYGSIIPSIIFHAMFNGFNFLLTLLPAWVQENAVLLFVVPVVSGIAWYFLEGRKKLSEKG